MKISVIIPVYNGERHLRAALESVFAQTHPLHEIITVDDGSTDSSPEILRSFGDRLTVIRQDNQGVAVARNTGLSHATGDAIAFLDQDDLWPPNRTRILVDALDSDPEAEVIVGLAAVRYERASPPAYRREVETTHREYLLGSQIIRARVFDRLGKLNTNVGYSDDADFLFHRLEHKMKAGRLDEVTLIYRMHDNNTSFPRDPTRSHMLSALRAHLWRVRATP